MVIVVVYVPFVVHARGAGPVRPHDDQPVVPAVEAAVALEPAAVDAARARDALARACVPAGIFHALELAHGVKVVDEGGS